MPDDTGEKPPPFLQTFDMKDRCEMNRLHLDDTVETWGTGRHCLHCGRNVSVRIEHYGEPPASGSEQTPG